MITLKKPPCLHVPKINEGESVLLSWGQVTGAAGYELESVFDNTFEALRYGKTWDNLDNINKSWFEFDGTLTWADFEVLPHDSTIFKGMGFETEAPDVGLTFAEADSKDLMWNEVDAKNLSWLEFERLYSNGLSWQSLDARFLSWNEVDDKFSWNEFEQYPPDIETHRAYEVTIPHDKHFAMFRIRAFNNSGEYSEYLTTDKLNIIKWDAITPDKSVSENFYVQLNGFNINRFIGNEFTLIYDNSHFRLDEFIPQLMVEVLTKGNGKVIFRCEKHIKPSDFWSGLVARVRFTSLKQGSSKIRFEQVFYEK